MPQTTERGQMHACDGTRLYHPPLLPMPMVSDASCVPPLPHSLRMAPFAHPMPVCILPPLLHLLLSVQ